MRIIQLFVNVKNSLKVYWKYNQVIKNKFKRAHVIVDSFKSIITTCSVDFPKILLSFGGT